MLTPQEFAALPSDDYLVQARRADLALARKITAECRRPVPAWNHDLVGPTEAWRQFLADTDPEWDVDDEQPAVVPSNESGVAA